MADPLTCNLLARLQFWWREREGEKVSSRPHPPLHPSISPWSLPLWLSLPIGHRIGGVPIGSCVFVFHCYLETTHRRRTERGRGRGVGTRPALHHRQWQWPSLLPLSTSRLGEGGKRTRRLLRRRRNLQNANLVKRTHSFLPSRLTHSATSSPLPLPPLLPFPDADKSRWR